MFGDILILVFWPCVGAAHQTEDFSTYLWWSVWVTWVMGGFYIMPIPKLVIPVVTFLTPLAEHFSDLKDR